MKRAVAAKNEKNLISEPLRTLIRSREAVQEMRKLTPTAKKYQGKYIARESFNSSHIIASGKDAHSVIERARKKLKSCQRPVITFVPDARIYYIF